MDDSLGAKILQPIVDSEELSQIERNLRKAIYAELKPELREDLVLVKIENWIAVPTLNFPDVKLILEHCKQEQLSDNNQRIYGVVLPIFGGSTFAYEVPLTAEGLQEFDYLLAESPFSPVLFTGELKPNWIIASMESEFHIVAGLPEIVEHLLGSTAEKCFTSFRDFVNQFDSPESAPQLSQMFHAYFSFIYDQLSKYKYVDAGSELLLTLS